MSDDVGGLVAVWDVHDPDFWCIHSPVVEWLTDHGVPVDPTYRVEIHLVDSPFARVFTWAENDEGCRYLDPATGEPAVSEPFVKMLSALPPAALRR